MNREPRSCRHGSALHGPGLVLALLLLLTATAPVLAKNSFLVAPGRVDFDLSRPNTQSFILTNNGDDNIRLTVEPVYFPVESKSLSAGEDLNKANPGYDDMRSFIRVSPRTVSLAKGQRRDVRISVRPPPELTPGDYRAHLLVRMLETAFSMDPGGKDGGSDDIGMKISIKMETGVAIYGHLGERKPELQVACGRNVDSHMILGIANPTDWRFEGWMRVYAAGAPADAKPLAEKHLNSLRQTRRDLTLDWKPPHNGPFDVRWDHDTPGQPIGQTQCNLGS